MPIQIYWKFYHQKNENKKSEKIFNIVFIFLLNKKNNVYPCKPQFYYIKVGFKGVEII